MDDKSDDDDRDKLTINEEVSRDMTAESDGMNLTHSLLRLTS